MTFEKREICQVYGTVYYWIREGDCDCSLFMIHGAGGDSTLFREQVEYLHAGLNIIVIDLPAHGLSEISIIPNLENYVDSILKILKKEKVRRAYP